MIPESLVCKDGDKDLKLVFDGFLRKEDIEVRRNKLQAMCEKYEKLTKIMDDDLEIDQNELGTIKLHKKTKSYWNKHGLVGDVKTKAGFDVEEDEMSYTSDDDQIGENSCEHPSKVVEDIKSAREVCLPKKKRRLSNPLQDISNQDVDNKRNIPSSSKWLEPSYKENENEEHFKDSCIHFKTGDLMNLTLEVYNTLDLENEDHFEIHQYLKTSDNMFHFYYWVESFRLSVNGLPFVEPFLEIETDKLREHFDQDEIYGSTELLQRIRNFSIVYMKEKLLQGYPSKSVCNCFKAELENREDTLIATLEELQLL